MKKKKFLFVTYEEIDFLILKTKKEGHEIRMYTTENKRVLKGFLKKEELVRNWKDWVDWADVIVFDGTDWGWEADHLRSKGHLVVGGSAYTDYLENDREFGQRELRKSGVATLPEKEFDSIGKVISFIKRGSLNISPLAPNSCVYSGSRMSFVE